MGFSRFGFKISCRVAAILMALVAAGYLLLSPGFPVAALLMAISAALLSWELHTFVAKTNREVTRFLDAARYADFGQRFEFDSLGAGFTELGETFTDILERFRMDRSEHEQDAQMMRAMLEHVPVPLLSIDGNEHIELWNNAARRLFANHTLNHLNDLSVLGDNLPNQLRNLGTTQRTLVILNIDDQTETFSLACSEISQANARRRLISLQNIQSVLDSTQLQAWQDLVRVLTHEIMNSITPVASLAQTTVDLVDDLHRKAPETDPTKRELEDIQAAVTTVARRSEGLMNFVASYRQLTRLPPPERQKIQIAEMFEDVERVFKAQQAPTSQLVIQVNPQSLAVNADRKMIEQVLINLLQNAAQSLRNTGEIYLWANLNSRGRVSIGVRDNGPGVDPDIAERIFVPFFTTKSDGSGVGLALSRQIMNAHGGNITYTQVNPHGANFTLTF